MARGRLMFVEENRRSSRDPGGKRSFESGDDPLYFGELCCSMAPVWARMNNRKRAI